MVTCLGATSWSSHGGDVCSSWQPRGHPFYLMHFIIYLRVWMPRMHVGVRYKTCKSQVCTSWLFSSTTWVLEIRLWLLGLAARAFAHLAAMPFPGATFVATHACMFTSLSVITVGSLQSGQVQ